MPTYDFKCEKCKKHFSLELSISDYSKKKRIKCPKCGSQKTERVFSMFTAVTSKKS